MKFQAVDINTLKHYKNTKMLVVLKSFMESEIPAAEVIMEEGEYSSVSSAQSALNTAIKRFKMQNITCKSINKKLYLINNILFERAVKGDYGRTANVCENNN